MFCVAKDFSGLFGWIMVFPQHGDFGTKWPKMTFGKVDGLRLKLVSEGSTIEVMA